MAKKQNVPDNPFVLSGYRGRKWFCDREKELLELEEHVTNERNVVLYAWRRMGKTALIKCFFDILKSRGEKETLYVDLLATQSLEEAIRTITRAVYDTYGKTGSGISAALSALFSAIGIHLSFNPMTGSPEISLGLNQPVVPEKSLRAIGEFLINRKKPLVIALDEFQQVSGYTDQNAEAIFRNWMQEFPQLRFIYCGSHRGMMQAMFTEKKRPFYKSAQLMDTGPIPLEEYTVFIRDHFAEAGKSIGVDMVEKIYMWCRGQTYSIQLVCNYLFGRFDRVKESGLQEVFEDILRRESAVFINYQKLLTANQWEVLQAVAKEGWVENPTGKEFVMGHGLGAASSVRQALQSLVEKELVVYDEGYMVHDILLSRWLAQL